MAKEMITKCEYNNENEANNPIIKCFIILVV